MEAVLPEWSCRLGRGETVGGDNVQGQGEPLAGVRLEGQHGAGSNQGYQSIG